MTEDRAILIVEDDVLIREGLRDFLVSEGFSVLTAENGQQGLKIIREQDGGVCLVLLDLQMPIMTGEQLLEALEKESNPAIRDVPVVVLTARSEGLRCREEIELLRKPIDLDTLLSKVRDYFCPVLDVD